MNQHPDKQQELKTLVDTFPALPGVYVMKDREGTILYIGKAKSLITRVRSYITGGDGRYQIAFLMQRVDTIDKIVCSTEDEAAILERDLILKHKPRYNIRLKDDKAFLHIRIDRTRPWPRIELVRRPVSDDHADYFGPYSNSNEIRQVLDVIKHVVPLRTCTDTVFANRVRPCLEYQIKRCAGPCCLPVAEGEYQEWVQQAVAILRGKTSNAIRVFEDKMERAAESLRFEEAALLRDRIAVLEQFSAGKPIEFTAGEQRDAWAIHREGKQITIAILTIRNGRIADSKQFSIADAEAEDEAILETAIEQHYEALGECPDEILVPDELQNASILVQRLSAGRSARVVLTAPKIGSKARLVALAQINAREYFSTVFDGELRYLQAANKLTALMRLSQTPRRIECVDISNLQGTDVVGAIVVYFDGAPVRRDFRRYLIKNQQGQDDFAAMYEVVSRRLDRGMETGELPDLLVIDGGPGQLAMALKARDERGVPLDIISIAKMRVEKQPGEMEPTRKPERLHAEWTEAAIPLDDASEVTHLLSRIRDEVHKYVITYHRERRAKRMFQSRLDTIPGLGPERKLRLLKVYGSSKAIQRATAEDIASAVKMPRAIAEEVLRRLRKST